MTNENLSVTDLRLAKGWSMRKLAKVADCSLKAVWDLENHNTKPSLKTLHKISKALDQDLGTFKHLVEATAPANQDKPLTGYPARSLGQTLGRGENSGPDVVLVVPMTPQEVDSMQKRLAENETNLENLKKQLGAAGYLST